IEANVGTVVTEQQTRNRLGEFGLPDASRTCKKRNSARAATTSRSTHPRDSSLNDIEHMSDRAVLPFDSALNESVGIADLFPINSRPWILSHTYLVATNCVSNGCEAQTFGTAELGNRGHICKE